MKPFRAITWLLFTLFFSGVVNASDLAREQRLHDEIIDSIMDGEAVTLTALDHEFLAIDMQSDTETPRAGVIILHGRGLHPDWPTVIQPLRTALPGKGWRTLALQMPVLDKEAKYYDYVPIFQEAGPRIDAAIDYLKEQGIEKIVLIAHSCGAHMAMEWVDENSEENIDAYVGIGMGATDYQQPMKKPFPLAKMTVPVLDIYAEEDFPAVLRMAPERKTMIEQGGNPLSTQQVIGGAEHYFNKNGDALVEAIAAWLEQLKF